MTNEECIHDLNEIKDYFLENFGGTYPAGLDYAINMINSGDAVQYTLGYQDGFIEGKKNCERPKGEWFPVSERLPEIATACIVQLTNGYITMGKYHSIRGGSWVFIDTTIQFVYPKDSVIAWQPLPEPYKEEGEEQ